MGWTLDIISLIFLLFLSGFFSGSEVALISLTDIKVKHMLKKKRFGALFIKKLKDNPQRMLATILIGNNLVNILASAITTAFMLKLFQDYAIAIATGVTTLFILIFGEITPKSIAAKNNEVISQLTAIPVWYMSIVFTPILFVLDKSINKFMKITGIPSSEKSITEEEIITIIKDAERGGSIRKIEKNLINNVFEFDNTNVSKIITPLTDLIMVNSQSKVHDAIKLIQKKNYSRLPVYGNHKDNIIGIVYLKDMIKYIGSKNRNLKVSKIMKTPYFVPETKRISSLLRQFQKRKEQMAIVIDEHGSFTGIITLEDILEEIVGEIRDETEKHIPGIRKTKKNVWVVEGKTDIDEINEKLKMNIKGGHYDTISGFILHHTGKIPKQGEEIKYRKFRLRIEERKGHRISKIRIEKV
ncbi:MAG: hemolysin family protein [Candidatus Woesearchaeota archaeon]|jgi:CBS domain containing-hemolysin-like protein|nr:hemolysin family protein [Candidatus Woesearchaeota archaeon]|tara:strand:+ start:6108 stop:7346 length:1239 start_codon:yes stop_codon:yes gene_type:complete